MQLHEQRDQLKKALSDVAEWKQDLKVYLHSSKFGGEMNDFINTGELLRHLENLQAILNDAS